MFGNESPRAPKPTEPPLTFSDALFFSMPELCDALLQSAVVPKAVWNYSIGSTENFMHASSLRQHYRPKVNRAPAWLRRIWVWL